MNITRKPYKTFTKEFKFEAVRLMSESNKPAAEIAAELGIRRNMFYRINWRSIFRVKPLWCSLNERLHF
jgi:transposase-like protein